MIDEAFMPFHKIIAQVLAFGSEIVDEDSGVRSYITTYEIESPIEMDIVMNANGDIQIGCTPPLYHVDTTVRPSFHSLRFTASLSEERSPAELEPGILSGVGFEVIDGE